MPKKTFLVLALAMSLLAMSTLTFDIQPVKSEPNTWTVDDDGPADFNTIQEAVNAVEEYDRIIVKQGIYAENIKVNKSLTIESEKGAEVTIVQAADPYDDVFSIMHVNHVNIKGFTVKGPTRSYACIVLVDASNNTVSNNILQDNGINLFRSSDNLLDSNVFSKSGLYVLDSYKNTVKNNTVNGEPLAYLEDTSDSMVLHAGQVVLVNCVNITLRNLNLSNTVMGVELYQSFNCRIINNFMNANTWNGISVFLYSSNNIISNNTMGGNWRGICVSRDSSNNLIENNEIMSNHNGIVFLDSSSNIICHNNFRDNAMQVYSDSSANIWDDGYPSGGNYWSDHICIGNPSNGSQPYIIDEDNMDHYPFQHQNGWLLNELAVTSLPITNITFTINENSQSTPYTERPPEGSYVIEMPEHPNDYVWSHWLEDGDTNRTKAVTMDTDVTLTGVFYHIADLNLDRIVDMRDIGIAAEAFGSYPAHPRWNPTADVNQDQKIDLRDIALVARRFGETDP